MMVLEEVRRVKATELGIALYSARDGVLADGSMIVRHSIQPDWVYVVALRPDGRFVRRRYRHDQMVAVES